MDLLSDLPTAILHDILARLPDKDAAKTSALSKAWRDAWFSFPNLSIRIRSQDFFTMRDVSPRNSHMISKMDILIDSVPKRLMRLADQGLAIKEFKLNFRDLLVLTLVSYHVDQWIPMASECGIEVLELHLPDLRIGRDYSQDIWYDLPLCVIEAKSLTKLVLASGIRIDQEFLSHSMKFSSLKLLSLSGVVFTQEGVIEHLIAHFPLFEHLTVKHCFVYNHLSTEVPQVDRIFPVKSLFLYGLQNLKQVDVRGIQEIHIDSPNLENLLCHPSNCSEPLKLNFDSCTNLRCLCISLMTSIDIGDKWGIDQPSISFLRSFKQLEVKGFTCSLREFVKNIKPRKILASVSLIFYMPFPIEPKLGALQVSSIPPSIKGVELLSVPEKKALYFPFMNYLFSSCFPKSISFRLCPYDDRKAFIEFFCEILMGRKEGKCHCGSSNTKCWWHALKIVKYVGVATVLGSLVLIVFTCLCGLPPDSHHHRPFSSLVGASSCSMCLAASKNLNLKAILEVYHCLNKVNQ
ncbi:hypothetical protein PIB30_056955 [Stylosanthes scabra]|uniref:F-box domain-containing protein n=1 Tax=Stylosanthes scabra TaxID=79078 RepID=A0ABU6WJD9_9FABA|nr:hypothetical protein [Stylosanthes scabra]